MPVGSNRSDSVTTPSGRDVQARMSISSPSACSTQISSVLPPPMSNTMACRRPASSSVWQPSTASRASSAGEMMSRLSPVSERTRLTNASALAALRQASVATWRMQVTRRRSILRAHTCNASMVRVMAGSDSRPVWVTPSPSRTMREKASITRKPPGTGLAISSRQLLVPRSSAE